jgi:hypothetical protein
MKAHEEEWQRAGSNLVHAQKYPDVTAYPRGVEWTPERLALAAQAPAMARLLLPVVNGERLLVFDVDRRQWYAEVRAVLRDAGVIE